MTPWHTFPRLLKRQTTSIIDIKKNHSNWLKDRYDKVGLKEKEKDTNKKKKKKCVLLIILEKC